jgi:YbgC/YbaW family acyl-CoA thioester hydrolase
MKFDFVGILHIRELRTISPQNAPASKTLDLLPDFSLSTGPITRVNDPMEMKRDEIRRPSVRPVIPVMFFDTDCAGVVHNIAYLRFIEVARTELAEVLGMGLVEMKAKGEYPVVVRTEIDYRRPATLGDRLVVHGWLDAIARTRFWCAFEVTRESDGELLVTSRQTMAVVMMPPGKPTAVPPAWRENYPHLFRKP